MAENEQLKSDLAALRDEFGKAQQEAQGSQSSMQLEIVTLQEKLTGGC